MFKMKVKQSDLPLFDSKDASKVIEKESRRKLDNILLTLQTSIAEVTPVGATGDLRSSLKTEIKQKSGKMIGSVFYGKKYALPVNDGRKASPVSQQGQRGLMRWIQKSRKGQSYFSALKGSYPKITLKQATFLLARSLKNTARKGQKFFEKGIKNAKPDINRIYKSLGNSLVKGLTK
jgi:hypothetical protein